ncbi:MAG: hypothetical protein GY804_10835 [Alphaproteobacteria bacterium]|nr:hypothetical protein [Alphaproteobacteria bacterium]
MVFTVNGIFELTWFKSLTFSSEGEVGGTCISVVQEIDEIAVSDVDASGQEGNPVEVIPENAEDFLELYFPKDNDFSHFKCGKDVARDEVDEVLKNVFDVALKLKKGASKQL